MSKLSIRHIQKISSRDEDAMIKKMRADVKNDPAVIEKFKEYEVSLNIIDKVHISFKEMDVSAKTKNKKIYLNKKMLDNGDDPTHYVAHEIIHVLQQMHNKPMCVDNKKQYLDKSTEEEAFKVQVDFKKRNDGEEEAKEYVDDLLDYHSVSGIKRKKKKKKLLDEE